MTPRSLRARVTLEFTTGFAALVCAACLLFIGWRWYQAKREARHEVRAAALLIQHEWDGSRTAEGIEAAIESARKDAKIHGWLTALDNVAVMIVDGNGHVLGANRYPHPPVAAQKRMGWLTDEKRAADATIIAGIDWRVTESVLRGELLLLLGFGILATGIAGISAWVLVGRTLRPIGALADQADAASADPLHIKLNLPSKDAEVRHLVGTLNGFLDRMRQTSRAREQFYAATAHELRSPLSVLSGSIEVTLSRPRDNAEYQETLTDLQHQTDRLGALVEGLLLLNRLHMNTDEEEAESVDLADICHHMLSTLTPLAQRRNLIVETELDSASDVFASQTHASILIRNLIENAVKYATESGTIRVSLHSSETSEQLTVSNSFDGALDMERLFEPFYRADRARSATTAGNGLGLAICRRIADANGWGLIIIQKNGEAYVTVTMPRANRL